MSQWPGNPGRKPAKPAGSGFDNKPPDNQRVRKPAAPQNRAIEENFDDDFSEEDDLTQPREPAPVLRTPTKPGQSRQMRPNPAARNNAEVVDATETTGQPITRIEIGRRAVAFIIDFLACYFAAVTIMVIPFVSRFLNVELVLMVLFLMRDFPFEGRGIGKNVMGLRIIDRATGRGPSLLQSAKRNVILIAPTLAFQIITLIMHIVPIGFLNHFVDQIVSIVGAIYYIIVLPLEGYRAYSRADGQRMGDDLAGTELTESAMDFSKPLPRDR
ncbi:MAG: RDD family protein [Candidatus Obscuribacterales bacterium]|nr:RDD family protein [Candidatus Obscuribacterales bacterium]